MDENEGTAGRLLWTPSAERMQRSRMAHYRAWLEARRGLRLATQADLWRWSVSEIEAFWESLWDYFDVGPKTYSAVLSKRKMPGAHWFVGAELNYAGRILAPRGSRLAVIHRGERGVRRTLSHAELVLSVARVRRGLERLGVARGDRVVGYVNNGIEALVAFLATASLGAIWSSCPPEFGVESVLDRFSQISPKVIFACGGYDYGGKHFDRRAEVDRLVSALGSLSACVSIGEPRPEGSTDAAPRSTNLHRFAMEDWLSEALPDFDATCPVDAVPFEHPLWILFSSGTTGLPKPIVHGHGGMLLEHLKVLALHSDLGDGDRFFWFSTTGWMMWNYLVGGLLVGATIVLYDGSPNSPDLGTLWRLAAEEKLTYFGASAPFLMACRAAKLVPRELGDLGALRSVGSTGAPLPAAGFEWVYDAVSKDVLLASVSGGTDLCTAFVASSPLLPVHAGELQCLGLGAKVQALDANAKPVVGQVGELVIAEPMPCMPVSFWNDPSGTRYRESYFEHYPGLWRHGDWILLTERGSAVISGRSDATLNRGGVRMGTSEFYRVVEELEPIKDSVVVDTSDAEGTGKLWLFVVLRPGYALDAALLGELTRSLRKKLSPRHVPDEIRAISEVPRTLSGKKLEVPIKRLLGGAPVDSVVAKGTLQNPDALLDLIQIANAGSPVRS